MAGHIEALDATSLRVHGEMSFATVPGLHREATPLIAQAVSPLRIDLGAVSRADSAGLALLVHWLRQGRNRGLDIHFSGLPAQLIAIARASGLEGLLAQPG